jgi:hypothetical protein
MKYEIILFRKIKEAISIMKPKQIFNSILAVLFVFPAPLAFAQTSSTDKRQATTTVPITVTGTIIPTPEEGVIPSAIEDGAAANYQPAKTLVVREDNSNNPGRYVLNGPGHVVDKSGRAVQTAIKPGARVLVYYISTGDLHMVDHVVVLD